MRKHYKKMIFALLAAMFIAGAHFSCGGSGDGGGGEGGTLTTTQQAQATALMQSMLGAINLIPDGGGGGQSLTAKAYASKDTTVTCPGGGTLVINDAGTTITFTNCSYTIGDTTTVTDGSFTLTSSGGTDTITIDLTITETSPSGSESFSISGSVSQTGSTLTFNISGSFEVDYNITGEITQNGDGTFTGSWTITVDSQSATCTFTNFDPETATQADYDTACGF
ncbi:MAG: hypothetical protein ABH871_06795 [Pseudomonadota bacterium]